MLISSHVAAGAAIGAATNKVVPAFVAGVASHFLMDTFMHWGGMGDYHSEEFFKVAQADGIAGLAEIALLVDAAGSRRLPVMAGIAGACLPDMDKPADLLLGVVPFPEPVNEFHKRIQRERPDRLHVDVIVAAGLAVGAYALLRALSKRR